MSAGAGSTRTGDPTRPRRRGRSAPGPRPLRRLRPDLPRELTATIDAALQTRRSTPADAGGTGNRDRGLARPARRGSAAPIAAAAAEGRRRRRRRGARGPARGRSRHRSTVGFQPVSPSRRTAPASAKGAPDQRLAQPRESDRRPCRGGIQPRLQLRGPAGRAGAAAGEGNGLPQDRGRPAGLRPERVHGLPLEPRPGQARGIRALTRAGALRLSPRARPPPQLRPPDPSRGRVQDRRAAPPRRVRDPGAAGEAAGARGRGRRPRARRATRWSTPRCARRPSRRPEAAQAATVATRAVVSVDDRRYVLEGPRATIGRAKDAACVLRDPNVSRHHAELRRTSTGDWTIADLGSTNGIKVNGRRVSSTRLGPGDEVTLGTTTFLFDVEQ